MYVHVYAPLSNIFSNNYLLCCFIYVIIKGTIAHVLITPLYSTKRCRIKITTATPAERATAYIHVLL